MALIFIWIQTGKEGIKNRKCHMHIGAADDYTKRITEAEKGIYQRYTERGNKDCYIFDSWFYSNKLS